MTTCPDDDAMLRYVDGALSPEDSQRVDGHAAVCLRCKERRSALQQLVSDLSAPLEGELDAAAHARRVLEQLDHPVVASNPPRPAWAWAGVGAMAAAMLVVAFVARSPADRNAWQARGGGAKATLLRDVFVEPCTGAASPVPLAPGSMVEASAPWTATFRNLGPAPAFLLLFAVDSGNVVHWIAPAYTSPADDPVATLLPPSLAATPLGTTAFFDDVSAGPLRVVAVVSHSPTRVSAVEALENSAWDDARLRQRLPADADVRETIVQVRPASDGGAR